MSELESRIERIEDAIIAIASAVEDGETLNLHTQVGEILFDQTDLDN